jgi:formate dehydrogenase iron-sulfur subunit
VTRVYVPGDSSARSVGADEVAARLVAEATARGLDVTVVRNGTRGLLWLEPLVEVDHADGRLAYGPVTAADVPALLDAGLLDAGPADHPLALGPTERIDWLARQQRLAFARVGVVDPTDPDDFVAHGGMAGLRRALEMEAAQVCDLVAESGLRGRGGAGFPTGTKWRTVLAARGRPPTYVACNADEGDSGTFADRMLMEGDPLGLLEGMLVAAHAVGASHGLVYIRSEYPDAIATLGRAVDVAYGNGWLGRDALGAGREFDVEIRVGAGAYICGEETAMLESLEGRRGMVRAKPPLPAVEGLFGRPTAVNNVLTLAAVPWVVEHGAQAYADLGVGRSRGTQVFQLAGNLARTGIVETAFGVTLDELVNDYGGGSATGRPLRAAQVGGPLGAYVPASGFGVAMDYEELAATGAMLGHGGVVAFDDTVDMAQQARFAMEFCAEESCGKCTPCRIGAVRGVEVVDRVLAAPDDDVRRTQLALLEDLCELMTDGSLCAMGGLTPQPVRSALAHFPEDFR